MKDRNAVAFMVQLGIFLVVVNNKKMALENEYVFIRFSRHAIMMIDGLTLFTVFSSVLWFTFALIVTHCVYTRPFVLTRCRVTLVYISESKIYQS